jgi:hypothetical protein
MNYIIRHVVNDTYCAEHRVVVDVDSSDWGNQTGSINAFRRIENAKPLEKSFFIVLFEQEADKPNLQNMLYGSGSPLKICEHADIWGFYSAIGYDHRRKSFKPSRVESTPSCST